jgi:YggT family protein
LLSKLLTLYWYVILARVVISWANPNPAQPIVRVIHALTEPVLGPIRRIVPPVAGLDLSPLVLFALIWVARRYVLG